MNSFKELIASAAVHHCPRQFTLALTDTMNVVSGKWKLPIIAALFYQKNRFKDLLESIEGTTPRMLSKELKELEINGIIKRKINTRPSILVEYTLTESGKKIIDAIDAMIDWGLAHRKGEMQVI